MILPSSSLRKGREQRVPESSNHSLFFLENDGNLGGNQLPDGSIGLSSRRRRRTICPSASAQALARVSPDFAFFRHFPGFFRVWLLLKPLSRSRSVAGALCVLCVCGCECVCCAVLCVWKNTENHRKQREMRVVWCVCVVWCCEVRKYTKTRETLGKFVKTWSLFLARYGHPRTEKRSKIGHFPQRIVFTFPLGFADDFGPRS